MKYRYVIIVNDNEIFTLMIVMVKQSHYRSGLALRFREV